MAGTSMEEEMDLEADELVATRHPGMCILCDELSIGESESYLSRGTDVFLEQCDIMRLFHIRQYVELHPMNRYRFTLHAERSFEMVHGKPKMLPVKQVQLSARPEHQQVHSTTKCVASSAQSPLKVVNSKYGKLQHLKCKRRSWM